jgi:hypothetical protein
MSKIDFRSGALTGRLAGMVGATWKGIDYVRKMVIPANPKSAGQIATRDVFSKLVAFGRRINSTVLKSKILPKPKKMSGFNKFIANNQPMIDAGVFAFADMLISIGSLFSGGLTNAAASQAAQTLTFTWPTDVQGEALATDPIILVGYNETQDIFCFELTKTRADASFAVALQQDVDDDCHGWIFYNQGTELASETAYATSASS